MSEQPREGTQERYIDQWPKPMFLCTHCDEQTDSDPCQECASVFDERGENYPPVLRFQVVPAPAQPEQPREGTRVNPDDVERAERWIGDAISRYYDHGCDDEADRDVMAMRRCIDALKARLEPAQPQPRGEGDDLAARLEEKSNVEEGLRPARPTNLPGPDLYHLGRAEAFAEAAQLARASTHPEQWGGSIRGCSPSSTRTPPTNAGRRGLAGSTDTNAPRGSCSNEPMPR